MNVDLFLIAKKSIFRIVIITVFILLIPFIAMQLTNEVNWQFGDFIVAAILLSFFGYLYEVLTKKSSNIVNKVIIGAIVFATLVFIWTLLAVDLI
jgi:hypothetical protein